MHRMIAVAGIIGLLATCSPGKANPTQVQIAAAACVFPVHFPLHHHPVVYSDTRHVQALQHALSEKGYNPGTIDGKFGPHTRRALVHFQHDTGIKPANGQIDDQTWAALGLSHGRWQW